MQVGLRLGQSQRCLGSFEQGRLNCATRLLSHVRYFLMRVFGVDWNIGKGVFILNIFYYYYLLGIQISVTNVNINLSQDNRVKDSLKSCQKVKLALLS